MTQTFSFGDEQTDAAYWAMRHLPTPPEVVAADNAKTALRARLAADAYREPTRDEKRLEAHYDRVIDAHDARVLDGYRRTT